jgi:hypothetical protein
MRYRSNGGISDPMAFDPLGVPSTKNSVTTEPSTRQTTKCCSPAFRATEEFAQPLDESQ